MGNKYQNKDITFSDCILNRERYADTIIDLINNSNSMTENNSFVIALDSPWGTGKSVFIKMLKNKIEDEFNSIKPVIYNAWENDYCENPFEPLFYDIISNEIFENQVDIENIKELAKIVPKVAKAFGADATKTFFKLKTAGIIGDKTSLIPLDETFKSVSEAGKLIYQFLFKKVPSFAKLAEQRNSFVMFKKYLTETSDWLTKDKKLLIIIDELDRRKPLYAIKTLEIMKHLFDVPNVVFLLAIDFKQLRHSISMVYGQGIDSEGYLRRFVNYILKLPEPSNSKYVDFLLAAYPLLENTEYKFDFISDIKMIFDYVGLSLRDINSIYENFRMFFISRYSNNPNYELSLPYLVMFLFKYKDIEVYDAFVNGESVKATHIHGGTGMMPISQKKQFDFIDKLAYKDSVLLLRFTKPMHDYLETVHIKMASKSIAKIIMPV